MTARTPLYDAHVEHGAKIVDFAGWDMPLHYGSQIEEHHVVRRDAGMFDVSHMTVVDLRGSGVRAYLQMLLANNVDKLRTKGKALYSCMLNARGGVIDDLILYRRQADDYIAVVNAAHTTDVRNWIEGHLADVGDVTLVDESGESVERRFRALRRDGVPGATLAAAHLGELP